MMLIQKQPFRGVLMKKCSENIQEINRRSPMPKCDFNKVVNNSIKITLRHGCSPVNLVYILRTPFPKNISGELFLFIRYNWYYVAIIEKKKKSYSSQMLKKIAVPVSFFVKFTDLQLVASLKKMYHMYFSANFSMFSGNVFTDHLRVITFVRSSSQF